MQTYTKILIIILILEMGFTRHLSPGEIVTQVLHVNHVLQAEGQPLRNVVFMGMGEPLHNYENVLNLRTSGRMAW